MKLLKKGMAAVAFTFGLFALADLSSAEPITGFNGFDWGTERQTVIDVHGTVGDSTFSGLDRHGTRYNTPEKSISGYDIEYAYYGYSIYPDALYDQKLQDGFYQISNHQVTDQSLLNIASIIGDRYGDSTFFEFTSHYTWAKRARGIDVNSLERVYGYEQVDGSAVIIEGRGYDNDLLNGRSGIQTIIVSYHSPGSASRRIAELEERRSREIAAGVIRERRENGRDKDEF